MALYHQTKRPLFVYIWRFGLAAEGYEMRHINEEKDLVPKKPWIMWKKVGMGRFLPHLKITTHKKATYLVFQNKACSRCDSCMLGDGAVLWILFRYSSLNSITQQWASAFKIRPVLHVVKKPRSRRLTRIGKWKSLHSHMLLYLCS